MTFDEWADRLDLRATTFENFPPAPDAREAWRCDGPCGQLMYGIAREKNWNYPAASDTPTGLSISKEFPHVCHVCWELYHNEQFDERPYWQIIAHKEKKKFEQLKREGDFLA